MQSEIERLISDLAGIEVQINMYVSRSKTLLDEIYRASDELAECNTLCGRYEALRTQYAADIQRLSFIVDGEQQYRETEDREQCPFCDGKLQPRAKESYILASQAELKKIEWQLEDLQLAESDLMTKRSELEQYISQLTAEKNQAESFMNSRLQPNAKILKDSLAEYRQAIELQKELGFISDLESALKKDISNTAAESAVKDDFRIKGLFDSSFFIAMDKYISKILSASQYVDFQKAYLNQSDFDVVVNGQQKRINGKGYRAYLNTVLALALLEFLADEGKYAPSLLVVDTPIQSLEEGVDDKTPDTMRAGLFNYMINNQIIEQIIIVENNIPPALDYSKANVIEFTKGKKPGRYGLLPGIQL